MEEDNAENGEVAELEADFEEKQGVEDQQDEERGGQAVEDVGVAMHQSADGDEGEHGGGADDGGGESGDAGVEPDAEDEQDSLEGAGLAGQLHGFHQEVEDHEDDADVHAGHAEDVAGAGGGVRLPQGRVQGAAGAQEHRRDDLVLMAAHP